MEAAYKEIADHLSHACPHGFERAWIMAELDDGYTDAQYWCEHHGQTSQPKIGSLESFKIAKALHQARDAWPQEKWSTCTFTLYKDGQFKLDVQYDD